MRNRIKQEEGNNKDKINENKSTVRKICESKSCLFQKINNINKPLPILRGRGERRHKISMAGFEKGEINTDPTIKR